MEPAVFGIFEPARFSRAVPAAAGGQKPFFSSDAVLRREERDVAILTGKLPPEEQEHRYTPEVRLASWLALMGL
jgi:hypothetical protein